jgi:hypothetical protein
MPDTCIAQAIPFAAQMMRHSDIVQEFIEIAEGSEHAGESAYIMNRMLTVSLPVKPFALSGLFQQNP